MLCPQGQNSSFSRRRNSTLKSEQKKVTANMLTLEFGKTPKVTVPDGTFPIPEARLEVKHSSTETQEMNGLIPLTLGTWVISEYTQTLSKTNNGLRRNPSQRANLAMLSLSCRMMAISHQVLLAFLKEKSTLALRKSMYLSRRALDAENHTKNSMRKSLTRHNSRQRQYKYPHQLRS